MSDQKISELTAITGANTADDDLLVIVDTSTGETKKITKAELTTTINNALIDGAPATLDTLNELAAALADDANFASTVTNSLAGKVDTTGGTMSGNLAFGDNDKAIFGAGSDLQIYHDGSNSYIKDNGTGNLNLLGAGNIYLRSATDSEIMIQAATNGAVSLRYDGVQKLATTSTGIDVTGTATMDGAEIAKASSMTQLKLERTTTAAGSGYLGASVDHCLVAQDSAGLYRAAVHQNGDLSLYEDNGTTVKFFWDASAGSLGIGTSSPNTALHVNAADGSAYTYYTSNVATTGARTGFNGTDFRLQNYENGHMQFYTNNTERMRLDSSGNLLVGGTSLGQSSATTIGGDGRIYAIRASDNPAFFGRTGTDGSIISLSKDGTTVGSISVTSSATAYNTSSDYRLKEGLQPVANASDRVAQLKPVNFAWKADGKRVDGFLAHELQEVIPEAVTGTKDAMRTEEYEVSPALGEIFVPAVEEHFVEVVPAVEAEPAYYDKDGNIIKEAVEAVPAVHEIVPAVPEQIIASDVERPEQLADGQQWRETTPAVMGEREVPDYQGIDQSKLVPLLTAALQEAITKIELLEARVDALENA